MGKVIIFAAPSGSGKSTIIGEILKTHKNLEFSISATSRSPRGEEVDGREYFFLSNEDFMSKANNGEFIEWEEVYDGTSYGTLHSEIERIWSVGNIVIFDIDVIGAVNLKNHFGDNACSIFVMPPSVEELRKRLILRNTDSELAIEKRVAKAEREISFSNKFDHIIVNDNLETAIIECGAVIDKFCQQ